MIKGYIKMEEYFCPACEYSSNRFFAVERHYETCPERFLDWPLKLLSEEGYTCKIHDVPMDLKNKVKLR